MKFTSLFSTAASLVTLSGATKVLLTVQNGGCNPRLEYTGLSGVHEGAGINYVQLGKSSSVLEYEEETGLIYQEVDESAVGGTSYNLTLSVAENTRYYQGFPFLELSVESPNVKWSISEEGTLAADVDDTFYIAKNVSDPYNYDGYFVGFGDAEIFGESVSHLREIQIDVALVSDY